jgi:hypothetical protein
VESFLFNYRFWIEAGSHKTVIPQVLQVLTYAGKKLPASMPVVVQRRHTNGVYGTVFRCSASAAAESAIQHRYTMSGPSMGRI